MNRGRVASGAVATGGGPPPDTDPPGVTSIVTSTDGTYVDLTVDEPSNANVPPIGSFAKGGTTLAALGSVSQQSSTIFRITMVGRILASETMTLSYTAGATPIQDAAGNSLPNFSGAAVTNNSTYEAETVVVTQLSDWSIADTEYLIGHPVSGLCQAGGGGGDGNGSRVATGGAGELRIWSIAAALAGGISGTIGTAGALGTGGNATNGGNSTVTDTGGTVASAVGGNAGNAVTNVAGTGGTGGSGGTGRAGGNGTLGAGSNTAGGATSGSSTAASGANPGEPEGAPAAGATTNPYRGMGGSGSSANAGRNGAAGQCVVVYQRAVVASSRPRTVAVSWGRDTAANTARDVSFGGTHAAGDRLEVSAAHNGASGGASMTGYTELIDAGTAAAALCYVRNGDGADPVSLATASVRAAWVTRRLRGAADVANASAGSAVTTTAQSDPPSQDHGSAVDALWIACAAIQGTATAWGTPATPANYEGLFVPPGAAATSAAGIMVCTRPLLATQTENPPQITTAANVSGATYTCCMPK